VRWHILSHFSGDPGPGKDGKLLATGGLEVGVKGYPWRLDVRALTAAQLAADLTNPLDYLDMPTARWHWKDDSPPFTFRVMPLTWGSLGHLGLDFWGDRGAPGNTSFFVDNASTTVPGPDGAIPTARFQMLREGIQDMHIRWTLVRAALDLPEKERAAVHDLLDEHVRRAVWGTPYLSQCEHSYDWPAYVARVQEKAAELAGVKTEARWDSPPTAP